MSRPKKGSPKKMKIPREKDNEGRQERRWRRCQKRHQKERRTPQAGNKTNDYQEILTITKEDADGSSEETKRCRPLETRRYDHLSRQTVIQSGQHF